MPPMLDRKSNLIDREFSSHLKRIYSPVSQDDFEKMLDGIQLVIARSFKEDTSLQSLLDETARVIYRLFEFKEISIGIKSREDGLYRYVSLIGFTKTTEKALRSLAYTYDEMTDDEKYPAVKIGRFSEFCVAEAKPYVEGEEGTYNRPMVLSAKRASYDDFVEGDYVDVFIRGRGGELIAFLELSNTKDGKLPTRESLRWLELIASVLGTMIERHYSLLDRERARIGKAKGL